MAVRRHIYPSAVPLIILTDAKTGRKVAINTGWLQSFSEGERPGTTLLRFTNSDRLTVREDFQTVMEMFASDAR